MVEKYFRTNYSSKMGWKLNVERIVKCKTFGTKPVQDNTVESWRQVLANRRCCLPTADNANRSCSLADNADDESWHQQQRTTTFQQWWRSMAMMTILQLCMLNILNKNKIYLNQERLQNSVFVLICDKKPDFYTRCLVFIACVVFQGLWSTLSNWPKWEHLQNNEVLVAKSASSHSDLRWSDRKTPSKATAQVSWLCYIKSWQMSTSHLIYWPKNLKNWSMVLIGGTWKT